MWSSEETRFYRAEANAAESPDSGIQRDSLRDLLCYEPAGRDSRSKQEFLSESLAAIESGVHCYSIVRNNMIVSCAWVTNVATKAPINKALRSHEYPPRSAVIYDFYVQAHADRQVSALLQKIVKDATAEGAEAVFVAIPAEDRAARQAAEEAGFKYQDSVVRSVRFGSVKTKLVVRANS